MRRRRGKQSIFAGIAIFTVCLSACGISSHNAESDNSQISLETGQHVNMGRWHGEDIEWRVLDIQEDHVLLLSEYVIDVLPYHEKPCSSIKWEDCTVRKWLNDTFYKGAFTEHEQEKIILSQSEGFIEYNFRIPGKPFAYLERETEDYIFLLSSTEKSEYLEISTTNPEMGDSGRLCSPTEYVKNNYDIEIYRVGEKEFCGWWLSAGDAAGYDYSLA